MESGGAYREENESQGVKSQLISALSLEQAEDAMKRYRQPEKGGTGTDGGGGELVKAECNSIFHQ